MKRALIFIAGLIAVIYLAPIAVILWSVTISPRFYPPAPPLLEHVTAVSGWFGGCPPRNVQEAAERARTGEALSPELNQKLALQFPPGSSADSLAKALSKQGFAPGEACENDPTIRRATFRGPIRGSIFDINAEIYWKAEGDTLVWTKGFVFFIAL